MNNIEKRVEKLEDLTGVGKREKVDIIVMGGDAEAKVAVKDYLATHPECLEGDIRIYIVPDERGKECLQRILSGELRASEEDVKQIPQDAQSNKNKQGLSLV